MERQNGAGGIGRQNGHMHQSQNGVSRQTELDRFHSSPPPDPLVGTVIHSRYELVRKIGGGGMSDVYLAIDKKSGDAVANEVALKIVTENAKNRNELTERFFLEAKALKRIDHPNVIKVLDIDALGDRIFCVMELIKGKDLSSWMAENGPVSFERAKPILLQICDALSAAHAESIIHRDIKPENIRIIERDGKEHVKVFDFGLAKIADGTDNRTRDDIVVGTPTYMAPEQAWSDEYDARADIYALGAIAYEMITGTPPFKSNASDERQRTYKILLMHKETPPIRPRMRRPDLGISEEEENIPMRALKKDPNDRYQSAREMRDAIDRCGRKDETDDRASSPDISWTEETVGPDSVSLSDLIDSGSAEDEPTKPSGRFMKRTVIVLAAAAAITIGYFQKDRVFKLVDGIRSAHTEDQKPDKKQVPLPAHTEYNVDIDTEPQGASVYDISGGKKKLIGKTPLHVSLRNWEYKLLITKNGYLPQEALVNRSQPKKRVALHRIPQQQQPSLGQDAGNGENESQEAETDAGTGDGKPESAKEASGIE